MLGVLGSMSFLGPLHLTKRILPHGMESLGGSNDRMGMWIEGKLHRKVGLSNEEQNMNPLC